MRYIEAMKIAHTSDTHMNHDQLELIESDILIHTGDFCSIENFSKSSHELEEQTYRQAVNFIDWLSNYPAKDKIITSGNYEVFLRSTTYRSQFINLCKKHNIIFKDDLEEIIDVQGIRIGGCGIYPHLGPAMLAKHAYFFDEKYLEQIPIDPIDILLSHGSPSVSDSVFECDEFRSWLEARAHPISYVLCGHVHEAFGRYKIGKTTVFNSATSLQVFEI